MTLSPDWKFSLEILIFRVCYEKDFSAQKKSNLYFGKSKEIPSYFKDLLYPKFPNYEGKKKKKKNSSKDPHMQKDNLVITERENVKYASNKTEKYQNGPQVMA